MWSLARRPRWIGLLILALAIAAGFAALGQWQLDRSLTSGELPDQQTETVVDLASVAEPQGPVSEDAAGQIVRVGGRFVPGQFLVLTDRINLGQSGSWVVGRFEAADAAGGSSATVAVALGWAPDSESAASAIDDLTSLPTSVEGRYLPGESPQTGDFEEGARDTLALSELVNVWNDFSGEVYGGYIVSHDAPAGLTTIDSPEPSARTTLNLLNLFYAAEWVIFAGFAIFMWYRLMRDAWEREQETEAEERAAARGGAGETSHGENAAKQQVPADDPVRAAKLD